MATNGEEFWITGAVLIALAIILRLLVVWRRNKSMERQVRRDW